MDLNEYQDRATETAVYPEIGKNPRYALIGLCEEVGEVAGQFKRIERDDGGVITAKRREKLLYELGDAQWYLARLASELGFTLEDVCQANLEKLADRKARHTLHGTGDKR